MYVTNPEYYLGRDGNTIEVRENSSRIAKLPIHNFENIVCFNYTGVSPGLLKLCAENGVTVTYMSPSGKYIGAFETEIRGSVLTRKKQYEAAEDPEECLIYSKLFIIGKIQNSIENLDRRRRDLDDQRETLRIKIDELKEWKEMCCGAKTCDELRGYEGLAARAYFSSFEKLILQQKEDFVFNGRNKRPPLDFVNALLSLAYGFLRIKVEGALQAAGLDPYMGFFHTERPGRTSLALDVMEEMRPYIADRMVLSVINRKQITKRDFLVQANGAVEFTEDGFKKFIKYWNDYLLDEITHPFLQEKIQKGLLPFCQAMLLAQSIRKELDVYPPYITQR